VSTSAVTVFAVFGAVLLCVILPSPVAFTSLVSAGGIRELCRLCTPRSQPMLIHSPVRSPCCFKATISAYALIAFLRFFFTPEEFAHTKFSLGPFRKLFYLITGSVPILNCRVCGRLADTFAAYRTWNVLLFAICSSPFFFPFTGPTFNFAIVIWAAVTIFGVGIYLVTPPEKWLKQEIISKMSDEIHGTPVARE
jgi:hypothetical protein